MLTIDIDFKIYSYDELKSEYDSMTCDSSIYGSINCNTDFACDSILQLQEFFGYEEELTAEHINVGWPNALPLQKGDIDTVSEILNTVCDYFCDYQVLYFVAACESNLSIDFIINPVHVSNGEVHHVTEDDIANICHTLHRSKTFRNDTKHIRSDVDYLSRYLNRKS